MTNEILGSIWRRRIAWSQAADRLGRRIALARAAALSLSCSGAVLVTLAATAIAEPRWRSLCSGLGAILLGVAAVIKTRFLTTNAVRAWTRARSVSEAIKVEVYAFRAGVTPYSGQDAIRVLSRKTNEFEEAARDLARYVAGMREASIPPPPVFHEDDYIRLRVEPQIEQYYQPKAKLYARRLAALRGTEIALGFAAAALGAVAAFLGGDLHAVAQADVSSAGLGAWAAVLTTIAGALATHIAASRYDFLVTSFYAAARRLENLVNEWRIDGSPTDLTRWSAFVRACEEAIAIENESWLAKWADREGAR